VSKPWFGVKFEFLRPSTLLLLAAFLDLARRYRRPNRRRTLRFEDANARSGHAPRGCKNLGRMPDLADWQRDRIHAPHGGRKVFRGVDSLTVPVMGWLRKRFARLRGSRSTAQVTPAPAPEPESAEAQPPTLSYRITVETPGAGEETDHYSRPGLPVTKDESIDLGGGRYVTVLEVVEEAQPGVKDGTIRAKRTPPPPST
jgi:hypothetical protein